MRTPTSRFLDLRALAGLQNMRFATRHRIEGAYSGRHRSRQLGGAGEFVDFHEYSAGEDLRRLDWKVLARTGRAYVRVYQDETNLSCTLVVDASGSMLFGGDTGGKGPVQRARAALKTGRESGTMKTTGRETRPAAGGRSKLEYAQFLATALSHIIAQGQDQVGLAVVTNGLKEFVAPGGTPGHVRRLQQTLEELDARPAPTGMPDALHSLFQRVSRRGVLLMMSDFLDDDLEKVFAAVRLFRHRQWEIVVLHIVHPQEERLPEGAAYRFAALEGEGIVDCSPQDIRSLYEDRFEAHCAMVRKHSLALGCDYRRVSTAVSYLETLGGFLITRAG